MIKAVFFDLDGTLADTAPDLTSALNQLRKEQGKSPIHISEIRPVVSQGGNAMLQLAFSIDESSAKFKDLSDRFLMIYEKLMHNKSSLFPGITAVLDLLESKKIAWGVITNKSEWLTLPLMQKLELENRAACIVSGDTTANRKPHPQPLLHACGLVGCKPFESIYVGDARRDIEAGNAAGMRTLIASWGYIGDEEDTISWQADGKISTPLEIMEWLLK